MKNSDSTSGQGYYGDLNKTQILQGLFEMPKDQRDDAWKKEFLSNVAGASFTCGSPQVVTGPDGFPYFQLNIPEPYKEFQCFVIQNLKDDFLLKEGIGVVINLNKGDPDWVFSYGDIVNFHLRNEFYSEGGNWNLPPTEVLNKDEKVLIGQPGESILPGETKTVIRSFLIHSGISNPKIMMMNRPDNGGAPFELVFNLDPEQFEQPEQFKRIVKSLSWFLPRHYAYVAMKENSVPNGFEALI